MILQTEGVGAVIEIGIFDTGSSDMATKLLASGRRLVLVTGRELDDLQKVCPRLDLFDDSLGELGTGEASGHHLRDDGDMAGLDVRVGLAVFLTSRCGEQDPQ